MGRRFCDIWSEIWPDISPLIEAAMNGHATYSADLPLLMNRKGYDEPTWFTFSYSPVRDETGQVAGMFCACAETTDAALATAMLIEELGGDCHVAYDAESGLRVMREHQFDAVLLDVAMARIDGYETCRRIRREFGDGLFVLAVTGFGQDSDKERAARAGFNGHLTEPADPAAVIAALREL